MNQFRQLWRELTPRHFYTKSDLVLDLATAAAIAVVLFVLFMHEFNLF